MTGISIIATGSQPAAQVVTNDHLAKLVDTSDQWIATRTGIRQRRFAGPEEDTTSLAIGAARAAVEQLEEAGRGREEIGAVLVATFSPGSLVPSTACLVQRELGLPEDLFALDINAACTGFLSGLRLCQGLLAQQPERLALLVGAEAISRLVDYGDRGTCILFGDGAGAAVVAAGPDRPFFCAFGARGDGEVLRCPGVRPGGGPGPVTMEGREVFRFAVDAIPKGIAAVLAQSGSSLWDIDWFVCHQANARILAHAAKAMGVPEERFFMNLDRYGNTSAASIPIALDEMAKKGLLKKGQRLMLAGFGGGLTWGAAELIW